MKRVMGDMLQMDEAIEQPKTPIERISALAPRIRVFNAVAIVLAAVLAIVAMSTDEQLIRAERQAIDANEKYIACSNAAYEMELASDYLTTQTRMYVTTGRDRYLQHYLDELQVQDRRGKASQTLQGHLADKQAINDLNTALKLSNNLADMELYAMRLVAETKHAEEMPEILQDIELSSRDVLLSDEVKLSRAESIVFGDGYDNLKTEITSYVETCSAQLVGDLEEETLQSNRELANLIDNLHVIIILLLFIVCLIIFMTIFLVIWPMALYARLIEKGDRLTPTGSAELRFLAESYNGIYDEFQKNTQRLKRDAERDSLTGLLNRGAFDALMKDLDDNVALLLVDVDYFKGFNDECGHELGDAILRKLAAAMLHTFRATDYACRVGGDEFTVILTNVNPDLRNVVVSKIELLAAALADTADGLPKVTLSVGAAFSGQVPQGKSLFTAADEALYIVKRRGRNGYAFYGEEQVDER